MNRHQVSVTEMVRSTTNHDRSMMSRANDIWSDQILPLSRGPGFKKNDHLHSLMSRDGPGWVASRSAPDMAHGAHASSGALFLGVIREPSVVGDFADRVRRH